MRSLTHLREGWVIDASLVLSILLDETEGVHAAGAELLTSVNPRGVVATHFDLECASGLLQAHRRGRIELDDAFEALLLVMDLPFERCQSPSAEVDALRLAYQHGISAYDAAYVAVSEARGLPLVTADARLVRALAGTAHDVRLLDDLESPMAGSTGG